VQGRADGSTNLLKGLQLLHGPRQLKGSLLNLLFQTGIRRLELTRHVVKFVGQGLKLVFRGDSEAIVEVTATEARRTVLQQGQRPHDATTNEQTGQHGNGKAKQ